MLGIHVTMTGIEWQMGCKLAPLPFSKVGSAHRPMTIQPQLSSVRQTLARMIRMYVAQQCLGLSDKGIEDATYDSQSIRAFVCIDLGRESAPDATTLLKFNHRLEANGLWMRKDTIVDARLIAATPSTKNKDGKRDLEMHQSKKGND